MVRRMKKKMSENNDILSQEEIDALMNNKKTKEDLNEEDKDILGEIGNIAMGSAATALYTLLDRKVEITAPKVELLDFDQIIDQYDRPCVLVKVEYIAGLEGINLLIINDRDAAIIADLMMGGDGTDPDQELDEMHTSAVGEAMNQMMGSASTSMSSIIDEVVNISPPEAQYLDLDEAIDNDSYFESDETLVSISFNLKVGNLIDSRFKQLSRWDFTKQLVENMKEFGSGLTAKEDNEQQDEVAEEIEEKSEVQNEVGDEVQKSNQTSDSSDQTKDRRVREAAKSGNKVDKEEVGVKSAQFPDFDEGSTEPLPQNMELIKDVPLQVTVRLGKSKMTIEEILDLGEGSIVELDKLAGQPVDLLVNGKLVAKGEVVVIDENFGFRVKDIISPMDRINNI